MSQRTLYITDDLSLPLDIITMRIAEYGDSGSGKTAFARLLAEKVFDSRHRFCAIDLKNDWWGLKSSADGDKAGIPVVIFGGPRADVKLVPDAAAAATLAETIASIDQPAIIDLDAMSRRAQEKFLTAFLDRFYDANRKPILLFCDEADRYAPQKPMTQEAVLSLSSSEDIARRGRKRGIGSCWLTQRTAVLNKNVSEFANLVVVFRTPGSKDLHELEERVGRIATKETVKEVLRLAPGLEDGQAFFLSSHPKLRGYLPDPVRPIQLPMPRTFDSSATPGVGQRRRDPKVLASADLAQIETKLAEHVQQAKDNDPGELRRRVIELQRQLAAAKNAIPAPAPIKQNRVEVRVLKDGQLKRVESVLDRFTAAIAKTQELAAAAKDAAAPVAAAINLAKAPAPMPAMVRRTTPIMPAAAARGVNGAPVVVEPPKMQMPRRRPIEPGDDAAATAPVEYTSRDQLTGPMRKIIDAFAWWHSIGVERPGRENIAPIAGYSHTRSRGFTDPLYACQAACLVQDNALTQSGRALAAWPKEINSLDEYHAKLKKVLPGPAQKLFDAIHAACGQSTRDELAAACHYTHVRSCGFTDPLYRISAMGLVDLGKSGSVTATDLFYPSSLLADAGAEKR